MDFQIPRLFLIRIPPSFVQIGALGARIRTFCDPGRFFFKREDLDGILVGIFRFLSFFLYRFPHNSVQTGALGARIRPLHNN